MADNDQLLQQIRKVVREENEPIKKDLQGVKKDLQDVKQEQAHIITTLETLEAGQKDIREQLDKKADKSDIQDLKAEVMKKIKRHDDRLDALEEHTGASNPHKN